MSKSFFKWIVWTLEWKFQIRKLGREQICLWHWHTSRWPSSTIFKMMKAISWKQVYIHSKNKLVFGFLKSRTSWVNISKTVLSHGKTTRTMEPFLPKLDGHCSVERRYIQFSKKSLWRVVVAFYNFDLLNAILLVERTYDFKFCVNALRLILNTLSRKHYKNWYIIAKQSDSTHCKKMYFLYSVLYGIDSTRGNSASIVTFMMIIKLSFKIRPRISEVTMREKFLSDRESNKKRKNINVM